MIINRNLARRGFEKRVSKYLMRRNGPRVGHHIQALAKKNTHPFKGHQNRPIKQYGSTSSNHVDLLRYQTMLLLNNAPSSQPFLLSFVSYQFL